MRRMSFGRATFVVVLAASAAVAAGAGEVDDLLARVDKNLELVEDMTYSGEIDVIRDGAVTKHLEFTVKLKGMRMKLVTFTAPGDVRGMAVLTNAQGHMYVYIPAYKRVRRVAAEPAS